MQRNNKAIVSVTNDLYTDQRVDKICLFLVKQGYDVLLIGRKRKSSILLPKRKYNTKRMNLFFEKGVLFYAEYNIRLLLFLLFNKCKILVSNDLDSLPANYLCSIFKSNSTLIYDSHEYFTEVPELVNRRKVQRIWESIERWIFPKLKTVYTVNESIADLYRKKYRKDIKVVRNISPVWVPNKIISKKDLNIPENKNILIIQGAGINIDRGAEEAVEAMKYIQDAVLLIVGGGDVIPKIKEYTFENQLDEKVLFFDKCPYNEMMNFTYHADLGLTLDKPTNLNYRFSLPNKVFDYIHAETPILATNLVEVAKIVTDHHVGILINDLTVENLANTINNLLKDKVLLSQLKQNCIQAKEILNWQNETKILEEIYPKVD